MWLLSKTRYRHLLYIQNDEVLQQNEKVNDFNSIYCEISYFVHTLMMHAEYSMYIAHDNTL